VETASRGALAEMRQMLGVLRHGDGAGPDGDGSVEPAPGLDAVDRLAEEVRAGGQPVTLRRTGSLDAVPADAGLCAYRVVQEALTNTVRHAPGANVTVTLDATDNTLTVDVTDDGTGPADRPRSDQPRYGLLGLRERVGAAGGTVDAGPRDDGPGWRVVARLPVQGEVR
jgi:signal transduction histidine kinase